jgi:hypothetical protein
MAMEAGSSGWNEPYQLGEGGRWRTLLKSGLAAWSWTTGDGAAVLAIVSPVLVNGDIYLTTIEGRAKTNRLSKDPRCALTFHHDGGSVTVLGKVVFDKRPEMVVMFLKGLEERVYGSDHEGAYIHTKHMLSPDRWICRFIPEKHITFDENKFLGIDPVD